MTIKEFEIKWKEDILKGIVSINTKTDTVIADRYNGSQFLCDRKHINNIQNDLRNMGYIRIGMGVYGKDLNINSMIDVVSHYNELEVENNKRFNN